MKNGLSVVLFGALALTACRTPFGPDQTVVLGVSRLDAPSTVAAAGPLDVVVIVQLGGCLSFDRMEVQRSTNGATLTAWGHDSSLGRKIACPADIRDEPHSVRFDPPFSGTFTVTVNRGHISPLQATVQVQ